MKEILKELQRKKLKKGEMVADQRGKVCDMKWKDKGMIEELERRKKTKSIPIVVNYYNSIGELTELTNM